MDNIKFSNSQIIEAQDNWTFAGKTIVLQVNNQLMVIGARPEEDGRVKSLHGQVWNIDGNIVCEQDLALDMGSKPESLLMFANDLISNCNSSNLNKTFELSNLHLYNNLDKNIHSLSNNNGVDPGFNDFSKQLVQTSNLIKKSQKWESATYYKANIVNGQFAEHYMPVTQNKFSNGFILNNMTFIGKDCTVDSANTFAKSGLVMNSDITDSCVTNSIVLGGKITGSTVNDAVLVNSTSNNGIVSTSYAQNKVFNNQSCSASFLSDDRTERLSCYKTACDNKELINDCINDIKDGKQDNLTQKCGLFPKILSHSKKLLLAAVIIFNVGQVAAQGTTVSNVNNQNHLTSINKVSSTTASIENFANQKHNSTDILISPKNDDSQKYYVSKQLSDYADSKGIDLSNYDWNDILKANNKNFIDYDYVSGSKTSINGYNALLQGCGEINKDGTIAPLIKVSIDKKSNVVATIDGKNVNLSQAEMTQIAANSEKIDYSSIVKSNGVQSLNGGPVVVNADKTVTHEQEDNQMVQG